MLKVKTAKSRKKVSSIRATLSRDIFLARKNIRCKKRSAELLLLPRRLLAASAECPPRSDKFPFSTYNPDVVVAGFLPRSLSRSS